MSSEKVRVASVGLGWWSDVLADGVQRGSGLEIVSCFTRSEDKRQAFAEKYNCAAVGSLEEILEDDSIQGIINTTPNNVHLETTRQMAEAGKHVFLDKPIANTIREGREITKVCKDAGVILSVGFQRRRESQFLLLKEQIDAGEFGDIVQAEANISRDREGKFDANSWRFQASGMPGGVMLQIGVHYIDVLEMLIGDVVSVSGMLAQLALGGDNPDVAGLVMRHDNGAITTLNAGYASASEYYLMNIYGREKTAYYSLHDGLKILKRHTTEAVPVSYEKNDAIAEELDEFAACIRGEATPTIGGERATRSLAVIKAGIRSANERRVVDIEEILNDPEA